MKNGITTTLVILSALGGYFVGNRTAPQEMTQVNAPIEKDMAITSDTPADLTDDTASANTNPQSHIESFDPSRVDHYRREIEKMAPGPKKRRALAELFKNWGATNGRAAFEEAKSLKGRERLACMSAAAAGWASASPIDAWDEMMLVTSNGSTRYPDLGPVVEHIAKSDAGLAVELIARIDDPNTIQRVFGTVIAEAAELRAYEEVLDSIKSIDSVKAQNVMTEELFESWGEYELDAPLNALSNISDSSLSAKALKGLMSGWARVDGMGAFNYAVENSSDPKMAELLSPIAREWTLSSSVEDASTIVDELASLSDGGVVLASVTQQLAWLQPELAMDSSILIENDRARAMTVAGAMRQWSMTEPSEADAYFDSMSYDSSKQQAFWSLFNVGMNAGRNPSELVDLAFNLGDSEATNRTLESMAEYTTASPLRDQSQGLSKAIIAEIEAREDIPDSTREKVLEWLNPTP